MIVKIFRSFFILIILLAILGGFIAYNQYKTALSFKPNQQASRVISLKQGDTINQAITLITNENNILKIWPYKLYFKLHPELAKVQAGDYLLTRNMTVLDVLHNMHNGKVVVSQFTLVEGKTFRDLITAIAEEEQIIQTLQNKSEEEIAQLVGIDGNPEGWFLPETYNYSIGTTDLELLKRMHQAMIRTLDEVWEHKAPDIAITEPYEALILASIIEKETGIADERKQISGVFNRRLKKNMPLQTDPTVMYGMDQSRQPLKLSDLKADTIYNTYTRKGLPPTPIAMPGKASLYAAVQPEDGDSLFFVANGKGGHTFTPTYEEHLKAVREFRNLKK